MTRFSSCQQLGLEPRRPRVFVLYVAVRECRACRIVAWLEVLLGTGLCVQMKYTAPVDPGIGLDYIVLVRTTTPLYVSTEAVV